MSCTICQHPKRPEIDQALMTGSATLAALSQEYGLSTSALHRHKAHLQAKVSRAKDRVMDNLRQTCLFWLSQALEMTMQIAQSAQAEGNVKLVLQAVRQGTRLITIILKQELPLDDTLLYATLASPQWATQASLLPHDPNIMALSRQALAGTLSSPCPDDAPPAASPDSPEDLALLQQLFPALATPPATVAQPPQRREKNGKSPGKTPCCKNISKKHQDDELFEKITAIMDVPLLSRHLPLGTGNSELETLFQQRDIGGKLPGNKPLSEYIYEQSLIDSQCGKNTGKCLPTNSNRPTNPASISLVKTSP